MARDGDFDWPRHVDRLRSLAAEGFSDPELSKILGVGRASVASARFRYGIAPAIPGTTEARQPPEDFASVAATLTITEAALRYTAGKKTVRRWLAQLDIAPKRQFGRPKKEKAEKPKQPKFRYTRSHGLPLVLQIPSRDDSVAASAQLHLQRFSACFRAKVIDPKASNDQWIVGGRRVCEAEMLSIAKKSGFEVAA